jgi:hypothetical protein
VNLIKKTNLFLGLLMAALMSLAAQAQAGVLDAAVVTAIDDGETAATAVLTAGVAIVGLFLLWKVIKRAAAKV